MPIGRSRLGHEPEALRTWPGAVHSRHPEAGVAAVGPDASAIALPHPLDDAYGVGTPYARVVERGGQVVLLGEPLDTVTLVHHAESIAAVGGKRRVAWRTLHDIDTSRGALPYEQVAGDVDYVEQFARTALERGAGRTGPLRAGTAHVFDARILVEVSVSLIEAAFGPDAA